MADNRCRWFDRPSFGFFKDRRCAALDAALFLLVFLATFALKRTQSGASIAQEASRLDVSWQLVLEYAARHGFQFGRDLVFTYGPLGYLFADAGLGLMVGERIVFALFWSGTLAWSVVGLAGRLSGAVRYLFLAWILIVCTVTGADIFAFLIIGYCGLLLQKERLTTASLASIAPLVLLSLIKFSFFIAAAAALSISVALQLRRRGFIPALLICALFCGAFLLTWLALGQQTSNLIPWVRGSLEIASGYSKAMSRPAFSPTLVLSSLSGLIFLWSVFSRVRSERRSVANLAGLLLICALTFLAWKQGFVRAHDHALSFLLFQPIALAMLCALPSEPARAAAPRPNLRARFFAVTLLCFPAAVLETKGEVLQRLIYWPGERVGAAGQIGKLLTGGGAECFPVPGAARHLEQKLDLPTTRALVGTASVDVLNFQQWAPLLNDLNYRPRPVIQGYSAYTPYLQELNRAAFAQGKGPEFLLVNVETIDERYPTLDDAPLIPLVLRHYLPVSKEKDFLVLKKTAAPAPVRFQQIHEESVGFDSVLDLTRFNDKVLVLQVEMNPTWWGRVMTLLYHAPIVSMELLCEGEKSRSRMVPSMARHGFLLNPLIMHNEDLERFYRKEGTPVEAVSFPRPPKMARGQLSDQIRVRVYRIEQ